MDKEFILIKDPVHGYIRVLKHEICVLSSQPFQRLRRLKQLATTHLVYPGAVHTRFTHSLGVAHVAGVFAEYLYSSLNLNHSELKRLVAIARLIGLLHDIGHGPFSHTFEDHVLVNYGINHEVLGGKIVTEVPDISKCFDNEIEKSYGVSAELMGKLIETPNIESWPLTSSISEGVTEKTLFYIIRGAYSADIIDYLLRDSLYTGANYGLGLDWQRLAYHSHLIGNKLVLNYKAKDVLDHLLIARLFMFKTVYYHKTVRAFDKIAGELLIKADPIFNYGEAFDDVSKYLTLDDEYVLSHPEVRKLDEAKYLLNRVVPYKAVYQAVIPLDPKTKRFVLMSKEAIKNILEEKFSNLHPSLKNVKDAIFVDTPKLPTNPMFEESEVYIQEPDGSLRNVLIRETLAGLMPTELAFLRVYVRDKYASYIDTFRSLVKSTFEGNQEFKSFY